MVPLRTASEGRGTEFFGKIAAVNQRLVKIEYKGLVFEEPLRFDVLAEDCLLLGLDRNEGNEGASLESVNTKRRCKQVKFCCGCINGLGQRSFEVN
jgi:hypothetical protein